MTNENETLQQNNQVENPDPILKEVQPFTQDLNSLAALVHTLNVQKGFYEDYAGIRRAILLSNQSSEVSDKLVESFDRIFLAQRLALIHSEVSEALEGNRKDLMDDKLPHRKMEDVEIVDAIYRLLDTAAFRKIDLNKIFAEKYLINSGRPYLHGKKF